MPNVIAINAQASQSIIAAQATSDDMLLESIADGNRTSMHILYCRHNVRVYRFILRIVRDATTAEDLVSQVFWTCGGPPASSRAVRRSRPGCSRSPASRR